MNCCVIRVEYYVKVCLSLSALIFVPNLFLGLRLFLSQLSDMLGSFNKLNAGALDGAKYTAKPNKTSRTGTGTILAAIFR